MGHHDRAADGLLRHDLQHRFAARGAQCVGVAVLRGEQITGRRKPVAQFFPGIGTGAIGQCAVQEFFGLRPLLLMALQ